MQLSALVQKIGLILTVFALIKVLKESHLVMVKLLIKLGIALKIMVLLVMQLFIMAELKARMKAALACAILVMALIAITALTMVSQAMGNILLVLVSLLMVVSDSIKRILI